MFKVSVFWLSVDSTICKIVKLNPFKPDKQKIRTKKTHFAYSRFNAILKVAQINKYFCCSEIFINMLQKVLSTPNRH